MRFAEISKSILMILIIILETCLVSKVSHLM